MAMAPDGYRYSEAIGGVVYWSRGGMSGSITSIPVSAIRIGESNGGIYLTNAREGTWFVRGGRAQRLELPGPALELDAAHGGTYLTVSDGGRPSVWWHDDRELRPLEFGP